MHFFTEPHTRKYVSNNQSLTKFNMKRLFLFYTNAVLSVLPTGLATRRRSITALVAHAFSLLAHSWGHGPELPPAVRLHASVLCRRCPCDFAISKRPVISLLSAFRHHRGSRWWRDEDSDSIRCQGFSLPRCATLAAAAPSFAALCSHTARHQKQTFVRMRHCVILSVETPFNYYLNYKMSVLVYLIAWCNSYISSPQCLGLCTSAGLQP